MLRAGLASRIARCAAIGIVGTGAVGTTALAAYAHTDNGLGFKREVDFWSNITPIVWDYWWNTFSSSPKVKFQAWSLNNINNNNDTNNNTQQQTLSEEERKEQKKQLIKELHERNAPKIYNVMLQLGGLYIKLGQVLSVTALPIPDQYREYFRTLQSNVPGSSDFHEVVKPTLERELLGGGSGSGAQQQQQPQQRSLEELFESIDELPCGAASIGQAHRATLRDTKEEVIVKVQYPDAKWQVPADIECVGQFLRLCVHFGLVDETASRLSYEEFARQFLAELDYDQEKENLKEVYASSLHPNAPYLRRGVVVPRVFEGMCTGRVITMTYLPGPKFEEEAREQLALLGIDTKRGMRAVVQEAHHDHGNGNATNTTTNGNVVVGNNELAMSPSSTENASSSWKDKLSRTVGNRISVDAMFSIVRFARRVVLWSTAATVRSIRAASFLPIVPSEWIVWAEERQNAILRAERWGWTEEAVATLLDVHGYQILNQGCFNADPHPGNILVVQDVNNPSKQPKIGLIDYGQVKRLTTEERVKIANLILSIADKESDEAIANNFRILGIKTKTDSTKFLAEFGRLMFGSFEAKHLDHSWHRELHERDRVLYFPNELSMVYRTALLLRGLAMSLQFNPSVGEAWRHHALETIRLHGAATATTREDLKTR